MVTKWQQLLYSDVEAKQLRKEKVKVHGEIVSFERSGPQDFYVGLREWLLEHGSWLLEDFMKKNSKGNLKCTDAKFAFVIQSSAGLTKLPLWQRLNLTIVAKKQHQDDRINVDAEGTTTGEPVYTDTHGVVTPVHYVLDWQLHRQNRDWKLHKVNRHVPKKRKNDETGRGTGKDSWDEIQKSFAGRGLPEKKMTEAQKRGLLKLQRTTEPMLLWMNLTFWEKFMCHSMDHDYAKARVMVLKKEEDNKDYRMPTDHAMHYEDFTISDNGVIDNTQWNKMATMGQWCREIYGLENPEHWKWSAKKPTYGRKPKRTQQQKKAKVTKSPTEAAKEELENFTAFEGDDDMAQRNSDDDTEDTYFNRQEQYKQLIGESSWKHLLGIRQALLQQAMDVPAFAELYVAMLQDTVNTEDERQSLAKMLPESLPEAFLDATRAAKLLKIEGLQQIKANLSDYLES